MRADLPVVTDLGGGGGGWGIFEQGLYSSGGYIRAFAVLFCVMRDKQTSPFCDS